ncbi:hypothetical protein D3P08_26095 [Paenibacillus nanensis]|uniref:Uncharacterized protein n=1 Tax=Paenibacillus nanensis TaxID=393251 RepID=A0A3A1UJK1_9BACL|nr:hypothetical protein [Paenibacillus nanensis]RIX46563.1 hypothetical protein D3P08_26095 [Paenibacillus nanensis]
MRKLVIILFLSLIPSIATMILLIKFFPFTGLARVITIPITLFVNVIFLAFTLFITQKIKSKVLKSLILAVVILITIFVATILHPQEYLPSVITQLREMEF